MIFRVNVELKKWWMVREWCTENLTDRDGSRWWSILPSYTNEAQIFFIDEDADATLFKMIWGENIVSETSSE